MYKPESYVLESLDDTTYIFLIRLFLTRSIVGIIVREFLFKYLIEVMTEQINMSFIMEGRN